VGIAAVFASGILVTIAVIGAITAAAGRLLGDIGSIGNYVVAVIFLLIGLHLLGVVPMPWSGPTSPNVKGRGLVGALVLGLVFGIAIGPCTFAFMAPMLGVTFRLAETNPVYGASLLAMYGVGHCAVIVVAGGSAGLVQRYLDWTDRSRGAVIVRGVCGILVILGGLYLVYVA
jgi:cytochrome c-type biogenesis protein